VRRPLFLLILLCILGADIYGQTPATFLSTASVRFQELSCTTFENVRCADQFASGSSTGGIAEAYANGPSTGVKVILGQDVMISSSQTITLTANKPLILDLNGKSILFSHTSGAGLTIFDASSGQYRTHLEISNGVLDYSGRSSGVTGLVVGNKAQGSLRQLNFINFHTTNSIALSLAGGATGAEDLDLSSIAFINNYTALNVGASSNQNRFSSLWFQANVNAVVATDASNLTFDDCLVQSSTGTTPVQFVASTLNVTGISLDGCYFENNGDGTTSSRQILFNAASGLTVSNVRVQGGTFEGLTNGQYGQVYGVTGFGSLHYLTRIGNAYNDFSGGLSASFTGIQRHFAALENYGNLTWTPPINNIYGAETTAPDALNVNVQNGHLLLGGGNVATVFGQYTTGQGYATWVQARNLLGANDTAYAFIVNPLGGKVGIGKNNPKVELDVNGTVNGTGLQQNGAAASNHCLLGNGTIYTDSPNCVLTSQLPIAGSGTTTSATSDAFTITGVTGSSHCVFAAANARAAANITTSYISAVSSNTVTLSHTAAASMVYNFVCTIN